jgi:CheY-like chemotaxis protein
MDYNEKGGGYFTAIIKKWLDMGSDVEMKKLLVDVLSKFPGIIMDLENSIQLNDKAETDEICHDLKGIFKNVGIMEIYDKINVINIEMNKPEMNKKVIDAQLNYLKRVAAFLPEILEPELVEISRTNLEQNDSLRVLVAEDNEMNQEFIGELLNRMGIKCEYASNGVIAIDMLEKSIDEKNRFNLILLDMQMPVMDGLDVITHIRSNDKFRSIYVIALTANAMQGDAKKYISAGCDAYISKPINKQIFEKRINDFLNLKKF